jgi:TRAP-type C4-dicarboxylate transport system permease large subunit
VLGKLSFRDLQNCFFDTIELSGSLFMIIMGSKLFSYFVVQTNLSSSIVDWIRSLGVSPTSVIVLLIVLYIVLGCFLEGLGMVLVTVPLVFPVIVDNGIDPIWFGVLLAVVVEIGLIHPPMGMNLFVIRAQYPAISVVDTYMGVLPFLIAPFILIVLMIAFPQFVLWLPHLLHLKG